MEDAKKKAEAGIRHGTVFSAGFQRQGRGRVKGRSWQSSENQNLMFTLVLRRDFLFQELQHLPLIAGVALLTAAEDLTGEILSLKWPNDLLYRGRKIAGILCEADSRYFYCGMGINCNQRYFPEELRAGSISLAEIVNREIDRDTFLVNILSSIKGYMESGDSWRVPVKKSLYLYNRPIEVRNGQAGSADLIVGINRGIGEDGQLLIETAEGRIKEIYAGEIEI